MAYDRTLIQIRERTFLDILDLALVVVRRRPIEVGFASLAGVLPCAALNAWLTSDPTFPPILYFVLLLLEAPWATAPLTIVLGGMMFGDTPSPVQVLRRLVRGLPGMIMFQLIGRAFLPIYPMYPSRLAFLNEVILLERGGLRGVTRRCFTLSGLRGGDFFGQWLVELFVGLVFVQAFRTGVSAITSSLFTKQLTWSTPGWGDFYGVVAQSAVWSAICFFGVARFLTYIDQRIRLEGWELRLRLQSVAQSMEEASRW